MRVRSSVRIFVGAAIILFLWVAHDSTANAEWRLDPAEVKAVYNTDGEETLRLDWGSKYFFATGLFEAAGWCSWPRNDSRLCLDYSRFFTSWEWEVSGALGREGNYLARESGAEVRWGNEFFSWETSCVSLEKSPLTPKARYNNAGWEGETKWRLDFAGGNRITLGVHRKILNYPRTDDSSDKIDLEGGIRCRWDRMSWSVNWREWSYAYQDRPLNNVWGEQAEIAWKYIARGRWEWRVAAVASRILAGNGLSGDLWKVQGGETIFMDRDIFSWDCYYQTQTGTSWVEREYCLAEDEAEDWGTGTSKSWGTKFFWQKAVGLHRNWRLGGSVQKRDGKDVRECYMEWDLRFGDWRLRLDLSRTETNGSGKEGAWLKMTYYFT